MDDAVVSPSSDVDQLGVLANLQALTGLGTDISTYALVLCILSVAMLAFLDLLHSLPHILFAPLRSFVLRCDSQ